MKKPENATRITRIYLVSNCFEDPNKIYIGKTINCRKSQHAKRFGDKTEYLIIDKVDSLKYKDWEPLETFWIEHFRNMGYELMNIRKTGGSGPSFQTQKSRNKISKSLTGIKHIPHKKGNTWRWKTECPTGPDHWLYGTTQSKEHIAKRCKPKSDEVKKRMGDAQRGKPKHSEEVKDRIRKSRNKSINQFDLEGNFIKEWESIKKAKKWLDKGDVQACCLGRQKTAGGFIWKYIKFFNIPA